jgi:class 3 adenylate cyclase
LEPGYKLDTEDPAMAATIVEQILKELSAPGAKVLSLLQTYQDGTYEKYWQQDPSLYRAFAKALIGIGQAAAAFELASIGLLQHPGDHELLFFRAWALARGRNLLKASEYVQELLTVPSLNAKLKGEALSLAGRLKKDRYQSSKKPHLAGESAELYETAHQLTNDSYPAVNAATMSLLAGHPTDKVRQLAQTALRLAEAERQQPGRVEDYWLQATLGEAHLLLGNMPESVQWYRQALSRADGRTGDIASMRRQVQLIHDRIPAALEILELLHVGPVVAFVGHMIDRPQLPTPGRSSRFPPDPRLEDQVRQAIREELDRLHPAVGYCCGACGSDLLFAELMLERQAELHLVLPFARKDFYETSVDFGLEQMSGYRQRFDAVVERAQVHYATQESYLGEETLLEFVTPFSQGLALMRAAELGVEPWTLAVMDPTSSVRRGGTRYFLNAWQEHGWKSRVIDLAKIRDEVQAQAPAWWTDTPPGPGARPGQVLREVKVMLFADVKNYSMLTEEQAPSFFISFLGEVIQVIRTTRRCPVLCNTWGDGLFLVFERVVDGADFALRLLERIQQFGWAALGLPADTTVRIGIHAGPVYPHWDQLIGRLNFFGTHVNRAARIEPKTPPGCVYASEHFAALLAVEPDHEFLCEYVGVHVLGKEHDRFRCPLYRLRRKEE